MLHVLATCIETLVCAYLLVWNLFRAQVQVLEFSLARPDLPLDRELISLATVASFSYFIIGT